MEIVSIKSEEEMLQFSSRIAEKAKKGNVFLLSGDLGVGKTFFARGFIKSLCGEDTIVRSPSFPLLQTYKSSEGIDVFHYDFYRLGASDEIYNLDIEHALEDAIVLIEWPSVAEDLLETLISHKNDIVKLDFRLSEDGVCRNVFVS